jgi:hypothetical protein
MTHRPACRLRSLAKLGTLVVLGLTLGCNSTSPKQPESRAMEASPLGEVARAVAPKSTSTKRPSAYTARLGPYAFHTDFPLDVSDPLYRELEDLPEQIENELQITTGQSLIQVFLFEDEETYHAFLRAKDPKLPLRSAYFFAEPVRGYSSGPDLQVYTWYSPRLKTDLRHELTHALLHGALKAVPIWLDEGLAGFFEQPTANNGVNPLHLDALRSPESSTRPSSFLADLARLEKLKEVGQMGRAEYQEAWAWVHYMLRGEAVARKVFLEHLKSLRNNPNAGTLSTKLEPEVGEPNSAMMRHLQRIELPRTKVTAR